MTMTDELKRVGVLGGTFDPIHNGHLGLAAETMQLFDLQKVLFIPVNQSPHKLHNPPASSKHRVAMLELALAQETAFSIELMEIEKGGVSYTIDTLSQLKERHPDWELFLILGADAFITMDTWKSYEDIFKLCDVLVGTRPDVEIKLPTKLGKMLGLKNIPLEKNNNSLLATLNSATRKTIRLYQIPPQDISSREIRQQVQAGKEIKKLLPLSVDHYIMKNQLYRTESPLNLV
ncbi:MAG: nicotinate-nucleotide adenylyltransferase [Nitrospina sp.]|jgi:nicotinate-nucleotide adenylyltransferase|nr:nicotinate-nucleotide adenylyltransferase [Nitrospina sp.]MBT3510894.1 nicotinate-nucleotide adenylyltransferase [Nitrospina sp.]